MFTGRAMSESASVGQLESRDMQQNDEGCASGPMKGVDNELYFTRDHFSESSESTENCDEASATTSSDGLECRFCSETVAHNTYHHLDALCGLCDKMFQCQGMLEKHFIDETTACSNCLQTVHGFDAVELHKNTGKCSLCIETIPNCDNWLKKYTYTANTGVCRSTYQCLQCLNTMGSFPELIVHKRTRTCPICDVHLKCRFHFDLHTKQCPLAGAVSTFPGHHWRGWE